MPLLFTATEAIDLATKSQISKKILDSLKFKGMTDRESRIKTQFLNTFQWLFADDSNFPYWLRQRKNEIFWITGVPASGKSTLMKYISHHKSLDGCLKDWAGPATLHTAKFYFWGPGSRIQRSHNGLLRSLLHQVLSKEPGLAEIVAPRRRWFHDLAGIEVQSPSWEWNELRECFLRLASHIQSSNERLALFIDGLDEYEGDHDELLTFLKDIRKNGAKLCVSSRPWRVFSDEFGRNPSLTMEKLTKCDIDLYVEENLEKFTAIRDVCDVYPEEVAKLIVDLKKEAKGVFLWVVLVVEQ